MNRLEGKVALITGGARGLGAATVRLMAEAGARIVFGDVLREEGEALAAELGEDVAFLPMDVTEPSDWNAAIARAQGFGPLNVLVNNAAVVHMAALTDTTDEDYMRVFKINQFGTFLGIRSVVEPMKAAGSGSIINVSSIDGLHSAAGLSASLVAVAVSALSLPSNACCSREPADGERQRTAKARSQNEYPWWRCHAFVAASSLQCAGFCA